MNTRIAIGALCLMLLTQGCAMDGVRRVTVIDQNSTPLTGVVVLPRSTVSAGINIGAEGKGPRTASRTVVEQAFLFDSGADLIKQQAHTRGAIIPIPPFIFIGKSRYVGSWLFLKRQHAPRALQRSDTRARGANATPEVLKKPRDQLYSSVEKHEESNGIQSRDQRRA